MHFGKPQNMNDMNVNVQVLIMNPQKKNRLVTYTVNSILLAMYPQHHIYIYIYMFDGLPSPFETYPHYATIDR